ncbi:MAG: hypothetical protein KGI06_00685 [Candidatus Micrarchaeota archaeon]|nr:hypothetical protein [Candidatus Micrarchaeota archaeon]
MKTKSKFEEKESGIKDENTYMLIFPSRKARIEGKEAMSEAGGIRQGAYIDGEHVSIVWGFQVRELNRLKIPYRFYTELSRKTNHNNHRILRK